MATIDLNGVMMEVDEDGFIQEPDKWTENVAKALAEKEGIGELTEAHWKVMNYLRNYFLENGIAPMVRKLTKETGVDLKRSTPSSRRGPPTPRANGPDFPSRPDACKIRLSPMSPLNHASTSSAQRPGVAISNGNKPATPLRGVGGAVPGTPGITWQR